MENYFTKKEQIIIGVVILTVMASFGIKFLIGETRKPSANLVELMNLDENQDNTAIKDEINPNNDIIMIHISGQVYNPGLIQLEAGERVIDAVEKAGGLKKEADLDRINLAKILCDEEKIYIAKIGEENIIGDIVESNESRDTKSNKTNINSCSKDQLMSLPGIGTVTADKIIEYREKNQFKTIEDIMNVSGIGTKKFEAIIDLISIK